MSEENETLSVGDTLEWADNMGEPHRWQIKGIHLAGTGGESLIEMESLTHKPGWTGHWENHPILWVPEVLCRHLRRSKPSRPVGSPEHSG